MQDVPPSQEIGLFAIEDIVARLGGTLHGDPFHTIYGIAPFEQAVSGQITFLANSRLLSSMANCAASALIVGQGVLDDAQRARFTAVIETENPYAYYARLSQLFAQREEKTDPPLIHATAVIDATARIAASARIGPYVTIGAGCEIADDVSIGAGCQLGNHVVIGRATRLHGHVVLYDGVQLGARVLVHAGAVIGADGFGFANDQGAWVKIMQLGRVRIGDDVEIGANTTIDRGALADTVIEEGVKLDNQIQIGHNVQIGAHSILAGCVGVAGSARIGKYCMIGGSAMILGHLDIPDSTVISAGSFVSRSIKKAGMYTGVFPLSENADWEKNAAVVRHLAELRHKVRTLERHLKQIETDQSLTDAADEAAP